MANSHLDVSLLRKISNSDANAQIPMWARFSKLSEEVGEANAAFLCRSGIPNRSASSDDNVEEEVVDALINCFDILFAMGMSVEDINHVMNKKCRKWASKLA